MCMMWIAQSWPINNGRWPPLAAWDKGIESVYNNSLIFALKKNHVTETSLGSPASKNTVYYSVFQPDFEIFRTIVSFIKISSGHSLIIKLIFIKFFRTIWEIGGQMSWDWCLAESLLTEPNSNYYRTPFKNIQRRKPGL